MWVRDRSSILSSFLRTQEDAAEPSRSLISFPDRNGRGEVETALAAAAHVQERGHTPHQVRLYDLLSGIDEAVT
jgi:hypothetical protein